MTYYHEDGHPVNVPRRAGYVHESGIVECGQCAVEQTRLFVTGGAWNTESSARLLRTAGFEPFEPSEGDDWCSRCDTDLEPRDYPQGRSRYPVGD